MAYDNKGNKVKSLDNSITDIELSQKGASLVNFCSWDRLKPYLAAAANASADQVMGVRLTNEGVEIILKS